MIAGKEAKLENGKRKFELALAPLKRILKRTTQRKGFQGKLFDMKTSEAAVLLFRKAVEDYAKELAKEAGRSAQAEQKNTIQARNVEYALFKFCIDKVEVLEIETDDLKRLKELERKYNVVENGVAKLKKKMEKVME